MWLYSDGSAQMIDPSDKPISLLLCPGTAVLYCFCLLYYLTAPHLQWHPLVWLIGCCSTWNVVKGQIKPFKKKKKKDRFGTVKSVMQKCGFLSVQTTKERSGYNGLGWMGLKSVLGWQSEYGFNGTRLLTSKGFPQRSLLGQQWRRSQSLPA